MAEITDEEWQNLYENFETTLLLDAVDKIDEARTSLGDGENFEPPEIRTDLLKLHQLAMDVINNGHKDKCESLFEMANDLEFQIDDLVQSLEFVQNTLLKLTELYPESLSYADE